MHAGAETNQIDSAEVDAAQLRPSNAHGALIVARLITATLAGIWLAAQPAWWLWACGTLILTGCLIQWFVVLHEAGHKTLFASQALNVVFGHVAGFFAAFPFHSWRAIHHQHHKWTGWQDKDPTTNILVPRALPPAYKAAMNFCWRAWIPVFALVYRLNNYWNLPRLYRLFPSPAQRRRHRRNVFVLLGLYLAIGATALLAWGPMAVLSVIGLPLLLSNQLLDIVLLNQHTHVPMQVSEGREVEPFSYAEQVQFTRSLGFPRWFSRWIMLGFDAHELHHQYPRVPGYHLNTIRRPMPGEVPPLRWALAAKKIPAHVFLYSNRRQSGLTI
ncbi:MAG: hypothetical protein HC927_01725 [Deltaproteobacteria bacterium]|nr:hypothetical protein [Deltaproteobacteria bacterium]